MSSKPKVIFKDVSKRYTLQQKRLDKILEILSLKKNKRSFYALRNVSFTVNEGETIGVIGINGSGKSTLSNLLAEVVPPTSGEIEVDGETSLIAISVGLNNNLTGLENINLKCLMHGMKKEQIKEITPQIIDFADLGDFIDQPVKNYSSGMRSRLGFAISAHTNPDVMVIDEALSVGDQTFYDKCINKMNEFKAQGKTIFFISHSASQVRSFCDKVIWLHYGELVDFGKSRTVINNYKEFISWFNSISEAEKKKYKREKLEHQRKEKLDEIEKTTNRRRRAYKEKKKNQKTTFQLAILFVLFIVSMSLMLFYNNPTEGMGIDKNQKRSGLKANTVQHLNKKNTTGKVLNKVGYVATDQVKVFKTANSDHELRSLNFMDEVFVEKQVAQTYQIKVGNKRGFISKKNIFIPKDGQLSMSDLKIEEILPVLPKSFQSSYQFYLAFLNEKADKIKSSIYGQSDETTDSTGSKFLNIGDVGYRFDQNDLSDAIIIKNIDLQSINTDELIQKATFKNEDGNLFYFLTDKYQYILDKGSNTFIISSLQNKSI
jgi:teichoic acid transport system ATP-binding protein